MPSFNLEKLRRLVEEQRMAARNLTDINERLMDDRHEMRRLHGILIREASSPNAQAALSEKMKLSVEELVAMSKQEILTYQVSRNGEVLAYELNINIQTFHKFIHARESVKRLEGVAEERRGRLDRYAIVSALLAAVGEWGFNTKEMGL